MTEKNYILDGIHIPHSDDDIRQLEKLLGVTFQRTTIHSIPSDQIEIIPLKSPISTIEYMSIQYKKI